MHRNSFLNILSDLANRASAQQKFKKKLAIEQSPDFLRLSTPIFFGDKWIHPFVRKHVSAFPKNAQGLSMKIYEEEYGVYLVQEIESRGKDFSLRETINTFHALADTWRATLEESARQNYLSVSV
jgi:hypothetical protein